MRAVPHPRVNKPILGMEKFFVISNLKITRAIIGVLLDYLYKPASFFSVGSGFGSRETQALRSV